MITITIKGPKDAVAKAVASIATLYQSGGRIVRRYEVAKAPATIPQPCDVVILTSEDK